MRSVGFDGLNFSTRIPYGGGGSMGTIYAAALAIASGAADVVVVYRAIRARSGSRFGGAKVAATPTSGHSGTTALQWCMPFGVHDTGVVDGVQRGALHGHLRRGERRLRARRRAVPRRTRPPTPPSYFYERPITLDDHQASRWIVEPCIRLFDCCQETDGSVALVLTSAERAADLRHPPVLVQAGGAASLFEAEIASDHYLPDLAVMNASLVLAEHLFGEFGISRDDIDVGLIYDAFSPIFLMQLEGLGFCAAGRSQGLHRRRQPRNSTAASRATPTVASSARATSTASTW